MAQLPTVAGPIPVTPTSHPFLGAGEAMEKVGYVEEEYFLSGRANVYGWVGATRAIKVVAGPGKYVTRILVRRPKDPGRFSGNIELTILNASLGVDLGGPTDFGRMVKQGDVWIGITTKALTAASLKKFDPVRYAPLDWSNPAPPAKRCAKPSTINSYMLPPDLDVSKLPPDSSPATEDGLVWDMIGQLGLLLKSDQRQQILPGFKGKVWVYVDGVSQSGAYMHTWTAAGFHDRYRAADGHPVFDGYLEIVGPSGIRINQCAADVLPRDPRNKFLPPPAAPYISLSSEAEIWMSQYTRQPDSVTPKGGIVVYEVAGGSHGGGEVPGLPRDSLTMASQKDLAKAGLDMSSMMAAMGSAKFTPNDFVWQPIARGAYHNLQLWVRKGVVPPHAPGIEVDAAGQVKRDQNGNALGGLRAPNLVAPVATHVGSTGTGTLVGPKTPFPAEKLKALYPDHATYVAKVSAAADAALAGRWISAEDAAAYKKAAEAAPIPPQ